ncbi:hypothetical protein FA13DRAFT_1780131 [Coprinellus micaceus]|uniref:DUF6533 domain-containing protein n=1 Tax=Coprinellus micaceus TaxID=71717 RepID=A0A4Y7SE83_COPMI|nr:hypothetical protein FA13DRAFT_1780131 [Coprinellus micaceus]
MSAIAVDQETADLILELLPQFKLWQIEEYVMLASYSALIYYYLSTFHEEVSHIWPQRRFGLGKTLFLTTRYVALSTMIAQLLVNWPTRLDMSLHVCQATSQFINISSELCRVTAEGILWVCLYALLEGRKKYFWVMILVFLGLSLPIVALDLANDLTQAAVETSVLDHIIGYPCNFSPGKHPKNEFIANYINLTRTILGLGAGLITIAVRYRKQSNNLIKVIVREGGLYYMSALVFRFLGSLSLTPGLSITDDYAVFKALRWILVMVFVDRLLLQMRSVSDPGTQAVISSLIFEKESDGRESERSTLDNGEKSTTPELTSEGGTEDEAQLDSGRREVSVA